MAGMLETIFFVSLSITFVLILLLVSHFKGRLAALEQKTESMYEIINYVTKEITTMKLLMQQAISLPSMAFTTSHGTQSSSSSVGAQTTHYSSDGLGESNKPPTDFCIKKIVVSDNEDEDDDDEDESNSCVSSCESACESDDDSSVCEGEGEEREQGEDSCVSLKVYINRDNTENEWETSDVSRLIDAHMLASEPVTMGYIRERNTDEYWPQHQQIIGLMGGGGGAIDLGMTTMIVMTDSSVISVGTTSSQVEEIGDNEDDTISIVPAIVVSESESEDESDYSDDDVDEQSTSLSVQVEEVPVPEPVVEELTLSVPQENEVPAVKESSEPEPEPEKYSQMDLATLKRIATERGIIGLGNNRKLKKVEIIRMLENL